MGGELSEPQRVVRRGENSAPHSTGAGRIMNQQLKPPSGEPAIRVVMMPRDTNSQGTIFGGVILSLIDQAAYVEAIRQAHRRFVTVSFHEVSFREPVFVRPVESLRGCHAGRAQLADHQSPGPGAPPERPGRRRRRNRGRGGLRLLGQRPPPRPRVRRLSYCRRWVFRETAM